VQPDGTRRKVCQVQIAKGFFSGKVQVTVPRYPGGEIEGNAVEIALGRKRAPSRGAARPEPHNDAPLNTDTGPAKASIPTTPDFKSALTGELAKIAAEKQEKQITLADARKRVGLKPNATESDVKAMEGLVAEIERDVKDFLKDPSNKITAPEQAVDTGVVLRGSYTIRNPKSMESLLYDKDGWDCWEQTTIFAGIVASSAAILIAPNVGALVCFFGGLWGGFIVTKMFRSAFLDSAEKNYRSYLRGPLKSKEPGSLGAIAESLRQAGLDCDICVGDWHYNGSCRVDLTVSLKPTRQA
jgi:hypothetical protein